MWLTIAELILTRAPDLIDLLTAHRNAGTVPTEQEIAGLGLSETGLDQVIKRLFPAAPAASDGNVPPPAVVAPSPAD